MVRANLLFCGCSRFELSCERRRPFLGEPLSKTRLDEQEFFFAFRRKVGVVFQNPDVQLFNANVFDELAFGPLQMGWPAQRDARASGRSSARNAH